MKIRGKKIITLLVLLVMLIGIVSTQTLATTNEKILLKKAEKEFLIYYKDLCNQEFQFFISANSSVTPEDSDFINSVKDQAENGMDVAYIDEALYTEIFGEDTENKIVYVWIKDEAENIVITADKIDLADALDDEMIEIVNSTTNRIKTTIAKTEPKKEIVDGVEKTVITDKIVIEGLENAKYEYQLVKVEGEEKATELFDLAEKLTENTEDTYKNLSLTKKFYDLYMYLMPEDWTEVENSEILQPENTVKGDRYILYIKEKNTNTIDAKFLTSDKIEEEGTNLIEQTITETVKLPVTFDSGAILFTVLGFIIVALIVFIIIKKKYNKKDEI